MTLDPRDIGEPGFKEWEEFRASYSSAFFFVWLLEELKDSIEAYGEDLHNRFMSGWDIQRGLEIDAELPDSQRGFPFPPLGGVEQDGYENNLRWMDNVEAQALYRQLFPHGDSAGEFAHVAAGMAVVALHAALEVYAVACGIDVRRGLPRALRTYLKRKNLGLAGLRSGTDRLRCHTPHRCPQSRCRG